jgi:hypothetical protein
MLLVACALSSVSLAQELPYQQFEQQIKTSVAPLAGKEIVGLKVLYLSSDVGPWLDTGLALKPGDKVTMVRNGKMWLSHAYNLSFESQIAVWARVGQRGPLFRGTETDTFVVKETGTLQLKTYPSQRWLDTSGRYVGEPAPVNPDSGGGASVAILLWNRDANVLEQLQRIADKDPAARWAVAELERQRTPARKPPAGWYYTWELGPSQIFAEVAEPTGEGAPKRAIDLHMNNDVAILKTDVSVALTPTTTLMWKWKADKIPASTSENTLPTHDYMSIAVEFDNGQDITFIWSHDLPVGESFRCPLPGWDFRETHIVARSGTGNLGKWLSEQQNVFDNYKKAVGGAMPKRITRVWLIAVSLFQKVEGMSQFGEIVLKDGATETRVFADNKAPTDRDVAARK